jgi:hypothetical protein
MVERRMPLLDRNTVSSYNLSGRRAGFMLWQDGNPFRGGGRALVSEPPPRLGSPLGQPGPTAAGLVKPRSAVCGDLHDSGAEHGGCSRSWVGGEFDLPMRPCAPGVVGGPEHGDGRRGHLHGPARPGHAITGCGPGPGGRVWIPGGQDRQVDIANLMFGGNKRSLHAGNCRAKSWSLIACCAGRVSRTASQPRFMLPLFATVSVDDARTEATRARRGNHILPCADMPLTPAHFADTHDTVGPADVNAGNVAPLNPARRAAWQRCRPRHRTPLPRHALEGGPTPTAYRRSRPRHATPSRL